MSPVSEQTSMMCSRLSLAMCYLVLGIGPGPVRVGPGAGGSLHRRSIVPAAGAAAGRCLDSLENLGHHARTDSVAAFADGEAQLLLHRDLGAQGDGDLDV